MRIAKRWVVDGCKSLEVRLLMSFLSLEFQNERGLLLIWLRPLEPRPSRVDLAIEPPGLCFEPCPDVLAGPAFLERSSPLATTASSARSELLVRRNRHGQAGVGQSCTD
jgi:hypothetical protein